MESETGTSLICEAEAELRTMFGHFIIRGYLRGDEESVALVRGNVNEKENVLVRIQSSCLFGETFHATDCDCKWQVMTSLYRIQNEDCGVFIYLFQEGRGIGIFEKIKAFYIQQTYECDTVEAFKRLGLEKSDLRTYDIAAGIIRHERILSVRLLTNNDAKIKTLTDNGIPAIRMPLELEEADFKRLAATMDESDIRELIQYLRVKRDKMGHQMVHDFARRFLKELDASEGKQ
jgi:GTP cyclohydrolase II